jgi:CheY-like chemotaxis protein
LQTIIEETLKLKSDRALNGKEALKLIEDRMVRN